MVYEYIQPHILLYKKRFYDPQPLAQPLTKHVNGPSYKRWNLGLGQMAVLYRLSNQLVPFVLFCFYIILTYHRRLYNMGEFLILLRVLMWKRR